MEVEYCGKIIRLLIVNHNRNRQTNKTEIRDQLGFNNIKTSEIILKTTEYFKNLIWK